MRGKQRCGEGADPVLEQEPGSKVSGEPLPGRGEGSLGRVEGSSISPLIDGDPRMAALQLTQSRVLARALDAEAEALRLCE